jgi:hypothetical protein
MLTLLTALAALMALLAWVLKRTWLNPQWQPKLYRVIPDINRV